MSKQHFRRYRYLGRAAGLLVSSNKAFDVFADKDDVLRTGERRWHTRAVGGEAHGLPRLGVVAVRVRFIRRLLGFYAH